MKHIWSIYSDLLAAMQLLNLPVLVVLFNINSHNVQLSFHDFAWSCSAAQAGEAISYRTHVLHLVSNASWMSSVMLFFVSQPQCISFFVFLILYHLYYIGITICLVLDPCVALKIRRVQLTQIREHAPCGTPSSSSDWREKWLLVRWNSLWHGTCKVHSYDLIFKTNFCFRIHI